MTEPQTDTGTTAEETGNEPVRRTVMVEWVNEPPHGTSLHRKRVITREEAKQGWGLTISKDLVWHRDQGFRLLVEGNEKSLTPEVLEHLANDPKFKLHTETVQD